MSWSNSDGLIVKFGKEKANKAQLGHVDDPFQYIAMVLDYENLTLTGGRIDASNPVLIPAKSILVDAWFQVLTGFVGAGATLDLGLSIEAGTYTGADEDGIAVAIATTSIDTAGKVLHLGVHSTGGAYLAAKDADGALTTTSETLDLYPSYDLDTAVYTAGKGILILQYLPTMGKTGNMN